MKNITVSVEDEVYHAARVRAAELRTSVSALVRDYLNALREGRPPVVPGAPDVARSERDELVRLFRDANLVLGYTPDRERTYGR